VVLCGLDEDVEEKEDEEREGKDREKWVLAEEAGVVEEGIGGGVGARRWRLGEDLLGIWRKGKGLAGDLRRKKRSEERRERKSAIVLREWGREKAMPWDSHQPLPFVKRHCLSLCVRVSELTQ